jgi:hypothetical protein
MTAENKKLLRRFHMRWIRIVCRVTRHHTRKHRISTEEREAKLPQSESKFMSNLDMNLDSDCGTVQYCPMEPRNGTWRQLLQGRSLKDGAQGRSLRQSQQSDQLRRMRRHVSRVYRDSERRTRLSSTR